MTSMDFKLALKGIEINLLASDETELISTYIDGINLEYGGPSSSLIFSIFHIQIDDMRQHAKSKFAVVLCPSDSGLNSHIRGSEPEFNGDGSTGTKWISVLCDWNSSSTQIIHIRSMALELQSLDVKIDGEMIVSLVNMLGDSLALLDQEQLSSNNGSFIPTPKLQEIFMNAAKDILLFDLTETIQRAQRESSRVPMFIESFYHSNFTIYFEVLFGRPDPSSRGSQSSNSLSAPMLSYMPEVLSSIAHTSPTIGFDEKTVVNYFGEIDKLIHPITSSFQQQIMVQAYKVLGSMDVIGDPISLFEDIGSGFEKFLQKTEDEITSLDIKGEGVKSLVYSVVGGIFNSVSKITGKVADLISSTTGTSIRRYDMAVDRENEASAGSQATDILFKSIVTGFSGMINEPGRGFSREGSLGAVKGLFKGLVSLIATPVAGTLDAVSVVTEGVNRSLQQQGARPTIRRKRHPIPAYPRDGDH